MSVLKMLELGSPHVDAALRYGWDVAEQSVGQAIKESEVDSSQRSLPRNQIVTSIGDYFSKGNFFTVRNT